MASNSFLVGSFSLSHCSNPTQDVEDLERKMSLMIDSRCRIWAWSKSSIITSFPLYIRGNTGQEGSHEMSPPLCRYSSLTLCTGWVPNTSELFLSQNTISLSWFRHSEALVTFEGVWILFCTHAIGTLAPDPRSCPWRIREKNKAQVNLPGLSEDSGSSLPRTEHHCEPLSERP